MTPSPIPALTPRGRQGHQFVCYADCCSGIPNTERETTFAALNSLISRLSPPPEFICFPGDEIRGLTADEAQLRGQWWHWFGQEMAWLDREQIPLYHTTGNHTVYDALSERVFREVMTHLPDNGPPAQSGLSYWLRREDLLLVFVNTMGTGIGGEGRVETAWLAQTLAKNRDARYKFVIGHHPVFPINGFSGPGQREIYSDNGQTFWRLLVEHQVTAYLCSHLLAFDVQVHQGVLQILTAGAGTPFLMPPDTEYHHLVQLAVNEVGLAYQVLDQIGQVREWLRWPILLPNDIHWQPLAPGVQPSPLAITEEPDPLQVQVLLWKFSGASSGATAQRQTLVSAWNADGNLPLFWIGLAGPQQQLAVQMSPAPGRSPHLWLGPTLADRDLFEIQVALHTGMGPGGLLWRWHDQAPWSSLQSASAWGAERLQWPTHWSIGHGPYGRDDEPVQMEDFQVLFYQEAQHFVVR